MSEEEINASIRELMSEALYNDVFKTFYYFKIIVKNYHFIFNNEA